MENSDLFRLDGHTLRVFAEVCATGSVSRAAETFNLNQSTVSYSLDKLRTALGDPLFAKSGRGIVPTDKALAILPRVEEILARIEGLAVTSGYDPSAETRPFTVAIPTPALLPEMRELYHKIRDGAPQSGLAVLRLAPRERLADMLASGEADIAIAIRVPSYPAMLNHRAYGTEQLVVFYDPRMRGPIETASDYAAAEHGVTSFGGRTTSVVGQALAKLGFERRITLQAPTASMLAGFIEGTEIVATMPRRLSMNAYKALAYCEPPVDLPDLTYDLVWHRRVDYSARNIWLRDLLIGESGTSLDHPAPSERISAASP